MGVVSRCSGSCARYSAIRLRVGSLSNPKTMPFVRATCGLRQNSARVGILTHAGVDCLKGIMFGILVGVGFTTSLPGRRLRMVGGVIEVCEA